MRRPSRAKREMDEPRKVRRSKKRKVEFDVPENLPQEYACEEKEVNETDVDGDTDVSDKESDICETRVDHDVEWEKDLTRSDFDKLRRTVEQKFMLIERIMKSLFWHKRLFFQEWAVKQDPSQEITERKNAHHKLQDLFGKAEYRIQALHKNLDIAEMYLRGLKDYDPYCRW